MLALWSIRGSIRRRDFRAEHDAVALPLGAHIEHRHPAAVEVVLARSEKLRDGKLLVVWIRVVKLENRVRQLPQ